MIRLPLPALPALLSLLAACSPATRRPAFAPMPEARRGELELDVPRATDSLARVLTAAGIPVSRVAARDGYLETPWFDTATGRPASGRPLGPGRVRVRGWVSPSRYRHSELVVETVFRPFADPSAAPRDLEQSVAYAHPVRRRVRAALSSLGALSAVDEPDALTLAQRRERDEAEKKVAQKRYAAAVDSAVAAEPGVADTALALALADTARRRPDSVAVVRPPAPAPTVTAPAPAPATAAPTETAPVFSIQVAASADRTVVDLAASRLRELGFTPRIVNESGMMKVRTGRYATESAARAAQRRLRTTFPDAFMTRR